jgi:DNA-directed RNA polymerase subunit RPC12/RpoP
MIRFRCGHCGHRISVAARHLGKLVRCPECAGTTHPLAEHVASRQPRTSQTSYGCANCQQAIGKLQKLQLWANQVVCHACHQKLSAEASAPALPVVTKVTAVPAVRAGRAREADSDVQMLARPFRGGLFGAMVGLCVAAAAMYGALTLLKDVAGLIAGLAFGGLALCGIYLGVRIVLASRKPVVGSERLARSVRVLGK